jgi:hypothetical protein
MPFGATKMFKPSNNQKKAILNAASFTLTTDGEKLRGKVIGFDQDRRGFGAIVVFMNGTRTFWGVNDFNLKLENLGIPPKPKKQKAFAAWSQWR